MVGVVLVSFIAFFIAFGDPIIEVKEIEDKKIHVKKSWSDNFLKSKEAYYVQEEPSHD
jgi:hypothetical protein|tara:strand:- start:171 stop:344 length:174 start_codon:yes stop_codon:yes gene_type:complete